MLVMLEQETREIVTTLAQRIIGTAKSVTLRDVLAADSPGNIKLFMQCEVAQWLHNDLVNAPRFSNIRFGEIDVRHLTRTYTRTIAAGYSFTRDEFMETLESAVHFVGNYLCRPQWTLSQFLFPHADRISVVDMQVKFSYLADYLYLPRLVTGYMTQKHVKEIGRADFRALLARIDGEVTKRHSASELARLAEPIFDFLLLARNITGKPIPVQPILAFFDDKAVIPVKEYIERICHIRNMTGITLDQLTAMIQDLYGELKNDVTRLGTDFVLPAEQSAPSEPSHIKQPDTKEQTVQVDAIPSALEEPEPSESVQSDETAVRKPDTADTEQERVSGTDRRNIALSLTFSGMTGSHQDDEHTFRDLRTMIDDRLQERFVHTIFQNDGAYYNVVIDSLNGMQSWHEASRYLKTFYQTSGIDPFLPDVVQFTDLVQLRYSFPQS